MYFYVDESGHSGPNLFDEQQPRLYYGTLCSPFDVDAVAAPTIHRLRSKLGVNRIHANEIGNEGLIEIANDLEILSKDLQLRVQLCTVLKPDHAVITFFDQIFDQGVNPANSFAGYWTPLRYPILFTIAKLFDEALAKRAWDARMQQNSSKANAEVTSICTILVARAERILDPRLKELITDSLRWAAANAGALSYNATSKTGRLSAMPNMIGFQSVLLAIASQLDKSKKQARRIVIDRQSQFNTSQKSLHEYYLALSKIPVFKETGLPELDLAGLPDVGLEFLGGDNCVGLELVDIYLWIARRVFENKPVSDKLKSFASRGLGDSIVNEVSLEALENRWMPWFAQLPNPTPEELRDSQKWREPDEEKRRKAVIGL